MMKQQLVSVYLPLKLDKFYTYGIKDIKLHKGDIVLVPFGKSSTYGVIYNLNPVVDFDITKLRFVIEKVSVMPKLQEDLLEFIHKFANYYLINIGKALQIALRVADWNFKLLWDKYLVFDNNQAQESKITPTLAKIQDVFKHNTCVKKKDLINLSKISESSINSLIKKGVIKVKLVNKSYDKQKALKFIPPTLLPSQEEVLEGVQNYIDGREYSVSVLQGVPGSGKTELYFDIANNIVGKGGQVLILLPEIALSAQLLDRFKGRFNVDPYIYNSSLGKTERHEVWQAAAKGDLKIVIGTRSALFLPFKNLGLIILDEEHDASYKQEEMIIYNARDMAVLRSYLKGIPLLLVSATPSIETMRNVELGKYRLFDLKGRYNQMDMPKIQLINMKKQNNLVLNIFSQEMLQAINETLELNQQVLLFVNRRGYTGCLICKECKEKIVCKNCSVNLVGHYHMKKLICHYCGYTIRWESQCPYCGAKKSLINLGWGVEQVAEAIKGLLPAAKVIIVSSDTINNKKEAENFVEDINEYKYNIIVGTQLISKGYHFPLLTMVGVLDTDFASSLDLKANERTWQTLYQVAGRSGRGKLKGKVLIQTHTVESDIIKSLEQADYNLFISKETHFRKHLGLPPYGKFAGIIISSSNLDQLRAISSILDSKKVFGNDFEILGPIDAPIFFLRKKYRVRYLIKAKLTINIQKIVNGWLKDIKLPKNVRLSIDIDPTNFY